MLFIGPISTQMHKLGTISNKFQFEKENITLISLVSSEIAYWIKQFAVASDILDLRPYRTTKSLPQSEAVDTLRMGWERKEYYNKNHL